MDVKVRQYEVPTIETLQCGKHVLQGMSIAGMRSTYLIPDFNACVDVAQGWPMHLSVDNFFITHGHLDHAAGIPYIISQKALAHQKGASFYMPQSLVEPLTSIVNTWAQIEAHNYDYKFVGLKLKDKVKISAEYFALAHKTYHRVDSVAYSFFHKKKKLSPEYIGLSQAEIINLKKSGIKVDIEIETPLMTFSGDSKIEFLWEESWIKNSQYLFIETTYIDDKKTVETAREWGHIHLDELISVLPQLNNEKIVLIHLSGRYSKDYALEVLKKRIPSSDQERIVLF